MMFRLPLHRSALYPGVADALRSPLNLSSLTMAGGIGSLIPVAKVTTAGCGLTSSQATMIQATMIQATMARNGLFIVSRPSSMAASTFRYSG